MERVVFDTNVWISGLLWRGKPYQCLLLARAGVVRAVYCNSMLAELMRELRETFCFSANRVQAVTYELRSKAELVEIPGSLHVVPDDPDDDKFVECAVVSGASVIVSGDAHLLNLREYHGIAILSPAEFLARLKA
jgi:putative PIN family toxin of toxin-antitoxin system